MKTCLICLNTIRRDHVKTHIKRHFPKIEELDEHEIHDISQKYSSSNFQKLENNVLSQMEKFEKKNCSWKKIEYNNRKT